MSSAYALLDVDILRLEFIAIFNKEGKDSGDVYFMFFRLELTR